MWIEKESSYELWQAARGGRTRWVFAVCWQVLPAVWDGPGAAALGEQVVSPGSWSALEDLHSAPKMLKL